jgi:hypothetical protein
MRQGGHAIHRNHCDVQPSPCQQKTSAAHTHASARAVDLCPCGTKDEACKTALPVEPLIVVCLPRNGLCLVAADTHTHTPTHTHTHGCCLQTVKLLAWQLKEAEGTRGPCQPTVTAVANMLPHYTASTQHTLQAEDRQRPVAEHTKMQHNSITNDATRHPT